jgi:ubiquinone biosynthesis O-methyltransferase
MTAAISTMTKVLRAHHCHRLLQLQRGLLTSPSSLSSPASFCIHRRPPHSFPRRHSSSIRNDAAGNHAHDGSVSGTNSDSTGHTKSSSNISPHEVDKFSSFASSWWNARSNPLVGMNPVRVKFITDTVEAFQTNAAPASLRTPDITSFHLPLKNKRILDIACGGGLLTESLSRLGASLVVGVDASSRVVEVAEMHSFHENSRLAWQQRQQQQQSIYSDGTSRNIRYIGGSTVEELAAQWLSKREKNEITITQSSSTNYHQFADDDDGEHELFDIITALEVIEHVPNPTSLLHAAKSLLKPNGILFVSTINRTIQSYGLAIIAAEYISGKVPVGTHNWNQFRCPEEVERMVCDVGSGGSGDGQRMKQIALSGMVIDPPFVNMNWSLDASDVDVNWIGAYQKQRSTSK